MIIYAATDEPSGSRLYQRANSREVEKIIKSRNLIFFHTIICQSRADDWPTDLLRYRLRANLSRDFWLVLSSERKLISQIWDEKQFKVDWTELSTPTPEGEQWDGRNWGRKISTWTRKISFWQRREIKDSRHLITKLKKRFKKHKICLIIGENKE